MQDLCRTQGYSTFPTRRGSTASCTTSGLCGAVIVSSLRRPDFYHTEGPDRRDRLISTFLVFAFRHIALFQIGI